MVADSRRARDGKFIEIVGRYNPLARGQEKKIDLQLDRIQEWIGKGAQPSDTVKSLIRKAEAAN
jgi:small subunit ribosomal protein S16